MPRQARIDSTLSKHGDAHKDINKQNRHSLSENQFFMYLWDVPFCPPVVVASADFAAEFGRENCP